MTMPSRRVPGGRGDPGDPYAERRARQALVEAFADAVPDAQVIRDIAARCGLQASMISFAGSAARLWTAVLHQAVTEGRVDPLLHEVRLRYPGLADAIRHYQEASMA